MIKINPTTIRIEAGKDITLDQLIAVNNTIVKTITDLGTRRLDLEVDLKKTISKTSKDILTMAYKNMLLSTTNLEGQKTNQEALIAEARSLGVKTVAEIKEEK